MISVFVFLFFSLFIFNNPLFNFNIVFFIRVVFFFIVCLHYVIEIIVFRFLLFGIFDLHSLYSVF